MFWKSVRVFLLQKSTVLETLRGFALQTDAFRGHGLSLLVATLLRGLKAHAIPAEVAAFRSNPYFLIYKAHCGVFINVRNFK